MDRIALLRALPVSPLFTKTTLALLAASKDARMASEMAKESWVITFKVSGPLGVGDGVAGAVQAESSRLNSKTKAVNRRWLDFRSCESGYISGVLP